MLRAIKIIEDYIANLKASAGESAQRINQVYKWYDTSSKVRLIGAEEVVRLGAEYNELMTIADHFEKVKAQLEKANVYGVENGNPDMAAIEAHFVEVANHLSPNWAFIASDQDGTAAAYLEGAQRFDTEWWGAGAWTVGHLVPGQVDWKTWKIVRGRNDNT